MSDFTRALAEKVAGAWADALKRQLDDINIEMCVPLSGAVKPTSRVAVAGDSDESKQSRFGLALGRVLLDNSRASDLVCFSVSMGIKTERWSKTSVIELEPDYLFVDRKSASESPPNLLRATAMLENAWTNRSFLDSPTPIDPGPFSACLRTFAMVDFAARRLVLFRKANNWQPEMRRGRDLPPRIDGLDFDIDWKRVYAEAGVPSEDWMFFRRIRKFCGAGAMRI